VNPPIHLDIKKDRGVTIQWDEDTTSYYSVAYLRRMSPSADMKQLREEMEKNPLAILPASNASGPLTILDAQLKGNYALWIRFSDGHETGIYSWQYLREIDPSDRAPRASVGGPPEPQD
jgi:DUF971 family protein